MNLLVRLNKTFRLSFNDSTLESKYQSNYLKEHLMQNILAAKIAIIIYILYIPLSYSFIYDELLLIIFTTLISISMPLYLSLSDKSKLIAQNYNFVLYLTAVCVGLGPTLFYVLTEHNREMFQVDFLIPIIGVFTMFGIGFSIALLSFFTVVIIFLTFSFILNLPLFDIHLALYSMMVGAVVSSISGYLIEKSKRKLFLSKLESDAFKYLIDSSHEFIAIYDIKTHRYLYANQAVLKINDCTLEAILTKKVTDIHTELQSDFIAGMFSELDKNKKISHILKLTDHKGEVYYTQTTLQYAFYKFQKVIINFSNDVTELKLAEFKIQELAERDSLTNLYNRYKMDELFTIFESQFRRYKKGFSLIICDIDYFKNINDTYGHIVGDQVLKKIATILQSNIRESDIIARWGGEEFAILLPNTNINEAETVAKKIYNAVRTENYEQVGNVYASYGVSSYLEEDEELTFFNRVDMALYEAKSNGRDQICLK